jgi:hypothetical protein
MLLSLLECSPELSAPAATLEVENRRPRRRVNFSDVEEQILFEGCT